MTDFCPSQLLSVRHGPGAAILPQYQTQLDNTPSRSQPTLLRIRLDFPPGNGPASNGARIFWHNHLRRLKYHNPALPIAVNWNAKQGTEGQPGPAWRLFLDFEGEENALRELATEPKNPHFKEAMEEELRPRPRNPAEQDSKSQSSQTASSAPSPDQQQQTSTQTTPATPQISTRTVSLPVLNRGAGALWFWFQQRTKCIDVPQSEADKQLAAELAEHDVKAEEDRQRVKKGLDKIKTQQLMLKMAKGEMERMKDQQ